MTPALARLKAKVREAVERCGGVDGAGATAGRSRSTAGEWMNRQSPAFPPADCALALDEAMVSQGHMPPITAALARELGGTFVFLPEGAPDSATMHALLADQARVSGELTSDLAAMLADGVKHPAEARAAMVPAERLLAVLVQMIAELRTIADGGQ